MIVVADSSPLVCLARTDLLHLLRDMFGQVLVPRIVWDEVTLARPDAPGALAVAGADWIRIRETPTEDPEGLGLDPGETAAIRLAEALGADLLLIDERSGRRVAEARRLHVRGTLGVLIRARQLGWIPSLRAVIERLLDQGFRLSPELVEEALSQAGEGEGCATARASSTAGPGTR